MEEQILETVRAIGISEYFSLNVTDLFYIVDAFREISF